VRSCTALDIFSLEGQVTETHAFRNQADISTVEEYDWYEWVKYHDTSDNFPDTKLQLGRNPGLAIDIGPVMARTILKSNGEITYKIDVISLTPGDLASSDEEQLRFDYDKLSETSWEHQHPLTILTLLTFTCRVMRPMMIIMFLFKPCWMQMILNMMSSPMTNMAAPVYGRVTDRNLELNGTVL
jgi:hypothetical protein